MMIAKAQAFLIVLVLGAGSTLPAQTPGASRKTYKPGETFRDCRNCPQMIVLPAGDFTMGSPPDEPERRDNEPQHHVTITKAFAMGVTPVTWDQWEACVRDNWCEGAAIDTALRQNPDGTPNANYRDYGRGTRPAVGMSWYDAQHYVGWLNWKAGDDDAYRLPSEAEWEYAERAGTTTAFPWGDELDHDYGNFGKYGHELGGLAEGRDKWVDETSPVVSSHQKGPRRTGNSRRPTYSATALVFPSAVACV